MGIILCEVLDMCLPEDGSHLSTIKSLECSKYNVRGACCLPMVVWHQLPLGLVTISYLKPQATAIYMTLYLHFINKGWIDASWHTGPISFVGWHANFTQNQCTEGPVDLQGDMP